MPDYHLEKIRESVGIMQERMEAVKTAELSLRLSGKEEDFREAAEELDKAVDELSETVKKDDKKAIQNAVEKAHTAYQKAESIFD
jgi:uncharacterized iron-regulated protein